ncbi:MAG: dTDP-4-dehydrorhamnose reductase [Hespellia sp.]|nr:dTDP-4-dehydrorhamnose reductase [Hespellia sp.]
MLKVWINGAGGQLGQALNDVIDHMEFEIFNSDVNELDITNVDDVLSFGKINRPDIIINCAGFTDVDACEKDPKTAYRVNALGARNLSIVAGQIGAKMVQLSTDDVFDGKSDSPYKEFDFATPCSVYGKSKLAGENYVKEFTSKHFIIRSNWVYGKRANFVRDFIKLSQTQKLISIASDQYGSPTSANELAKFILYIIETNEYGTYHATCTGSCSRYAFAKEIARLTNNDVHIEAAPSAEAHLTSIRPAYAVLDNFILSIDDVYTFPDWKDALATYVKEMED